MANKIKATVKNDGRKFEAESLDELLKVLWAAGYSNVVLSFPPPADAVYVDVDAL